MAGGQSGASAAEAGQSPGRAWQPYRGVFDLPGRLSRSATIALIASPIGLLVVSVIRLLIVADYNPATASAIVSSGGYVDTLLGTIIPLVPIFTPYLALLLLFFNRVIPGLLTLLAAAFMSPVALPRPVAVDLAGHGWYLITHRNVLVLIALVLLAAVFAVLLVLEFMGLGFGVVARTAGTVASIALIPLAARGDDHTHLGAGVHRVRPVGQRHLAGGAHRRHQDDPLLPVGPDRLAADLPGQRDAAQAAAHPAVSGAPELAHQHPALRRPVDRAGRAMRLIAQKSSIPAIAARYLLPHEQKVITVRQHPARLLPALTMAAGGLLAAAAVNGIAGGVASAQVVVWVLAGFLVARALLDVLVWSLQYIVITDRRMILSSGLLGRNITVIPLQTLQNLAFARSTGGRVLGYGAFTFEADGQARAVIDYIPYPEQLYLEIYGVLYPDETGGDDGGDGPGGFGLDLDDP